MVNVKESTPEDLYNEFMELAEKEKLFDIVGNKEEFLDYLSWMSNDGGQGFFVAPASTKYHGNYPGGLYEHSRQVYTRLKDLTRKNDLKWKRPQSPFIIGMFHDLCKCDQYKRVDVFVGDAPKYEYNDHTLLKGHGSKSAMLLSRFINLTEEEMLCVMYHMGAYEKDDWAQYDMAIRKCENVLWAHQADMLASKTDGI